MPRTTKSRGRRQIAARYDLGNDLFSLFLDPSMNYSAGIYENSGDSLEQAQINKMDRIAERLEAAGWRDFPTYFQKCSDLLERDGLMLLQAIVIDDDAYELEKASRSFISHFIFPGGCLPSLREIDRCLGEETDLSATWQDDIGLDYAKTLADWRSRFLGRTDELEALGYDRRFRRMWLLYLCVAEGGFRSGRNGDLQMAMAKPRYRARTQPAGKAPAGTNPA